MSREVPQTTPVSCRSSGQCLIHFWVEAGAEQGFLTGDTHNIKYISLYDARNMQNYWNQDSVSMWINSLWFAIDTMSIWKVSWSSNLCVHPCKEYKSAKRNSPTYGAQNIALLCIYIFIGWHVTSVAQMEWNTDLCLQKERCITQIRFADFGTSRVPWVRAGGE